MSRFAPSRRPAVVMLGHSRLDSSFTRRARMFLDAGAELTTFSFRRDGHPPSAPPGDSDDAGDPRWRDIDLGPIEHARHRSRLGPYVRAARILVHHRRALMRADVLHARNLDLALLLLGVAFLIAPVRRARTGRTIVYEALDVHFSLTGRTLLAPILRALERRVLRSCDLLITSSEAFVRHYFEPVQGLGALGTPWLLVENKLWGPLPGRVRAPEPGASLETSVAREPIRIVWAGHLRCPVTMHLLLGTAARLPDTLRVELHGRVSRFVIGDVEARIAAHPNVTFHGPYPWPAGLRDVYRGADLCFAQDLHELRGNSAWCVPNRLYESAYHAVPSLAVRGTETARLVRAEGFGFVLDDTLVTTLVAFLDALDRGALQAARARLESMPRARLVSGAPDACALLDACLDPRTARHAEPPDELGA